MNLRDRSDIFESDNQAYQAWLESNSKVKALQLKRTFSALNECLINGEPLYIHNYDLGLEIEISSPTGRKLLSAFLDAIEKLSDHSVDNVENEEVKPQYNIKKSVGG